ncbi:hypothetical protein ABT168_39910, partial [Streptomyces sp. NPDC001793]|uniref:hypothetical protein n=1 Tax=Streptomyces sp. NPDC001793 TaxID=3154657 RepID=UPI00332C1E41
MSRRVSLPGADELFRTTGGVALQASTPRRAPGAAGGEDALSTVQVDLHQPRRFDLSYVGPDGARHRPVM